ncbi:hypothetical protein PULV_b0806 [Pseudoalteromonas ulvae UL12]|uniref:MFS transporter n=1 Tax=Pseudoalteromonas ulvae TaxID=107327 RepID=A0A244CSJ4_PSEDV|nr:MFS transporter [Pseudoalteromonas ulvae]MBE0366068.1 hypothetical protein [Pseudoalteromonas ulvae UL12]OUL58209.1 MFS transporter [Pseudoalteromonas ulvae]
MTDQAATITQTTQQSFGLSLFSNVASSFIASTAMGMLAILVPVHLANLSFSDSTIGNALAFETIASLMICLLLPNMLRRLGLTVGLLLSGLIRVPTIIIFPYFSTLDILIPTVFLHGIGCYALLILLQTWVNSIPFKKNKGLMIAIYSTSISVGLALGPVIVNFLKENPDILANFSTSVLNIASPLIGHEPVVDNASEFVVAALLSAIALLPTLFLIHVIPTVGFSGNATIWQTIVNCKGAMYSIAMAGVSQFGVAAFITIYGMKNGLSLHDASLLLTSFMIGSLVLEVPIAWLSDYFDRRYFIVWCSFASMVCAVYLPIAIYTPLQAWILVFIWGGVIAGIYSVSLALVGEKYPDDDEAVAANAGYSLMESIGGTLGIVAIGFSMEKLGTDGMPYVIMFASILYFSFALTRYRIE